MRKLLLLLITLFTVGFLANCTQYIYGPIAKSDDGYFYLLKAQANGTNVQFIKFKKEGNKLIQQ